MPDPYEIATWRFEQIAPLIDPSLDAGLRKAALRERTSRPVPRPGQTAGTRGRKDAPRPLGKSTLYRWIAAYRKDGFLGLLPKPREDRDRCRRSKTKDWVHYAIGLLYEQPDRSLTQLEVYLQAEFSDYSLGQTTLRRHLKAHPAFAGIERLRSGKKSKLRDSYEADHPHEGWQLDGKGPFTVRFADGAWARVHVLSIVDDHSRAVLAAVVSKAEDTEAAITVFEKAVAKWGLAERFQFDRGSAFDSLAFRKGLAALGVHRNHIEAKSPEWNGKVEAYHRSLGRWFVKELRAQEVVDLEHLQQLLEAMLALVYDRHTHRVTGMPPEQRLAGRCSGRQVSPADLKRAFWVETKAKSCKKTGEVRLPNGRFRVPSTAWAGQRSRFRHHPFREGRAVLVTRDDREIELRPFITKPLADVKPRTEKRGTGQLQKLVDLWQGKERPNAQPGFGLPEVFAALGQIAGRPVPGSEREAGTVVAFYRRYGPLPREGFEAACRRCLEGLGSGRSLHAYLDDLERQIRADRQDPDSQQEDQ